MCNPVKIINSIKAPSAKLKTRIVGCGNYLGNEGESRSSHEKHNELYAAGVDLSTVRFCIALASARQFTLGATDIKTAFLNARLLPRARELAEQVALEASGVPTADELELN